MKKLLFIILLMVSMKFFSQETVPVNIANTSSVDNTHEKADKLPEYPGGINAFRKNFSQTFSAGNINCKGMIKSEAQLIISEEGNVTDIKIIGDNKSMNKEMERVAKLMSKTKWTPAKIDGKPVKFRFKLPITMNFE